MHRSFKIRYIVTVKCDFVEISQFFNIHFCSCCKFTLKVFDLQRCTIYQKIAFFMGVLLVPSDFFYSVYLLTLFTLFEITGKKCHMKYFLAPLASNIPTWLGKVVTPSQKFLSFWDAFSGKSFNFLWGGILTWSKVKHLSCIEMRKWMVTLTFTWI